MEWDGLRDARKERGMTAQRLALRAGYSLSHVKNVESGRVSGSRAFWFALMDALGMDEPPPEGTPPYRQYHRRDTEPDDGWELGGATPSEWGTLSPRTFEPGRKYKIGHGGALRYLRKDGAHHVFQSAAGWLATWTDAQLAEEDIGEC